MVQSWNPAGVRLAARLLFQPQLARPHLSVSDIRDIPFERLAKAGLRGIAFDKDNCLTRPYADALEPCFAASTAWRICSALFPGRVCIVSNSAGTPDDHQYQQAARIEQALGVPVLKHQEKKPAGTQHLLEHFAQLGVSPHQLAMVGDRLLTDVYYGHRAGALTIHTHRILDEQHDNRLAAMIRRWEHQWLARTTTPAPDHPILRQLERQQV